jgi:hypothetical protein
LGTASRKPASMRQSVWVVIDEFSKRLFISLVTDFLFARLLLEE